MVSVREEGARGPHSPQSFNGNVRASRSFAVFVRSRFNAQTRFKSKKEEQEDAVLHAGIPSRRRVWRDAGKGVREKATACSLALESLLSVGTTIAYPLVSETRLGQALSFSFFAAVSTTACILLALFLRPSREYG
jgi:hypothetical protein